MHFSGTSSQLYALVPMQNGWANELYCCTGLYLNVFIFKPYLLCSRCALLLFSKSFILNNFD